MALHSSSLATIVFCVDGQSQEKMLTLSVDESLIHATETTTAIALSF